MHSCCLPDRLRRSLLATLATLGVASAQTTVAVPCARDNTLYESATGSLSNGSGTGLYIGLTGQPAKRRALLQFDVAAQVPAGARIISAQLTIHGVTSAFGGPLTATMHRLLQPWGEGNSRATGGGGQGAPAQPGDATWLHRFYPTSFWNTPGGDFAPTVSATIITPPYGLSSSDMTTALITDVQSFLDQPANNHGWLLKTNEATPFMARKLDSRESNGIRPSLSITYLMPGEASAIGQGCLVQGMPFTLQLSGPVLGGSSMQILQQNGPANQLAANLIGLGFELPGTPLLAGCRLLLPVGGPIATNNLLQLDSNGQGATAFPLPLGFSGVTLTLQTAALDASPVGFTLSNGVLAVLQ